MYCRDAKEHNDAVSDALHDQKIDLDIYYQNQIDDLLIDIERLNEIISDKDSEIYDLELKIERLEKELRNA